MVLQTGKPVPWDQTFQLMSWWDTDSVRAARIMVVGAGALGNEVLKNLALLNVGHILIVDFDTIEYANLSRSVLYRESDSKAGRLKSEVAAERIREINPNIRVMTIHGDVMIDVGLGVFRRMDAIIGCLDNRLARLMINRQSFRVGKTWIDGAIENLAGQLVVYKPDISCYECQLTEAEWNNIRFKMGCPDVARRNSAAGKIPTTPISASIIGAMQVQEALKIIHGNEKQSMAGEVFQYEGMNNLILQYKVSDLKEDCGSHFPMDVVEEAPGLSADMSIAALLDALSEYLQDESFSIQLDHEVVLEVTTEKSELVTPLIIAKPHLSDDLTSPLQVFPGEEVFITRSVDVLDRSFPDQALSLRDIGIPPLHILAVECRGDIRFIELSGDAAYLSFT